MCVVFFVFFYLCTSVLKARMISNNVQEVSIAFCAMELPDEQKAFNNKLQNYCKVVYLSMCIIYRIYRFILYS